MAARRLLVFLAGALAIGIGAAWVASDFRPVLPADQTCLPDVAYAVDVQEDQATFDLPFEPGTRYRVIVASLAASDVESSLTLSAKKVPAIERFPLSRMPVLQSAIPKQFSTSWNHAPTTPFTKPQGEPPVTLAPESQKAQRTFFLHVTDGPLNDPRQYAKVSAVRVAEGRFARVFLDSQMNPRQLAKGLVSEIIRLFDEEIVPGSLDALGEFRDVDGDGKFAILISPWLGKLEGGKTSLGGFVRGSDFQKTACAPFGNRADVLYLNANLQPGPHLKTLLAHEFAHAICFSERLPTQLHAQGLPAEEDWLNEAIAHLAENLLSTGWTNLDHRVSRFLDAPHESPLVVRNYYANGLWRDPGCRGATYLFLRFVVDQFGEEVLSRIIHNPEQGIRNVETAAGVPFAELFRRWTIALAQAGQKRFDEEETTPGQFHSLDLSGRLGRWSLQGTRAVDWNLAGEAQSFHLMGTTSKIFEVLADTPGIYRLRIRTTGNPKLQVTVIRQADEAPQLEAIADWQTSEALPATCSRALKIQIQSPVKIVRLAVESADGTNWQSNCWEADQIPAGQIVKDEDLALQEFLLNPPARMFPSSISTPTKWLLKILAEDEQGRRSAKWIDLPPPPLTIQPVPIAAKPARPIF